MYYLEVEYLKAKEYVKYCRDCDYTLDLCLSEDLYGYVIFTAAGTCRYNFESWEDLIRWMAQRYDDEKEAGNI